MSKEQDSICFAYKNTGVTTDRQYHHLVLRTTEHKGSMPAEVVFSQPCGTQLKPCCYPTAATRSDTPSAYGGTNPNSVVY